MRGNGLFAASYAPVADLDPRIADMLLELLADAGVAAYAEPSQGERGPYLDVHLPTTPSDRLYVDRAQQQRARLLLAEQLPQLRGLLTAEPRPARDPADVLPSTSPADDAWAQLVAGFHQPVRDPVPRWPVLEDVDEDSAASEAATDTTPPAPAPVDAEEHFVPPPPPPLPRLDPVTRLGWAGLVGGPAVLLVTTVFGQLLPPVFVALAVVAFIAGFVTLVVRMDNRPPDDRDSDSGAVL
jgi:hypothetical protein